VNLDRKLLRLTRFLRVFTVVCFLWCISWTTYYVSRDRWGWALFHFTFAMFQAAMFSHNEAKWQRYRRRGDWS
jgi:hypothetical protein